MANDPKMAFDGCIRADSAVRDKSVMEGYRRKGGQNSAPDANAPRPPAPPAFRPAAAPAAPTTGGNSSQGNETQKPK
jgi:hypothetical protein